MKYNPQDATDNPGTGLLEPDIYPFKVVSADDTRSNNGNDMIKVKLLIGSSTHVFDNLLSHPKMVFKLKHFFEAVGIAEHFERGEISAKNCLGKTGYVKIAIEPASGQYKEKNVVDDYVVQEGQSKVRKPGVADMEVAADDIPF